MNNQNTQNSQSIFDVNFKDIAIILLRRIWAILLAFAIGFGYAYYFKEKKKVPVYTSSATMYVTNSNNTKYVYSSSDSYNASALIATCSVVIKTNTVMELVSEQLDNKYSPGQIKGSISVSSVDETEVMRITARTTDPEASAEICNAIIDVIPKILKERIKVGAANELDRATPNYSPDYSSLPSSRTPMMYGGIAAALVAVIIVLSYILDTRIKSKEEITAQYGIPVLSDIPNFNLKSKERYHAYYEHR